MDLSKVMIVVPCLDESATIAGVVRESRRYVATVLVVDDGSSDNTADLARGAGATVIRHATPRGKGLALQAGWEWARQHNFTAAITMDGDGQHACTDIPCFLENADAASLLLGNRMGDPVGMPWLRRSVNRWMSRRLSRLTGVDIPDSQCGFRLIHLEHLRALELTASRFEIESDLLVGIIALGLRVKSVPIRVVYGSERSKINPLRDTVRWFRWYLKARRRFQNASVRSGGIPQPELRS